MDVKRFIKNNIWYGLRRVIGVWAYEHVRGRYNLGYKPQIKHPTSFNEKIIHRKFFNSVSNSTLYADKYRVRDYVRETVGPEVLNELYAVVKNPDDLPYDDLPEKFIVKTNNGSGTNIIVTDKNKMPFEDIRAALAGYKSYNFGYLTNELWYLDIDPMIIVEELLEDATHGIPPDYKFFCFHGKCKLIQVDLDRFKGHKRIFYDRDWNMQDFTVFYPMAAPQPQPENLPEMIEIAEKLAQIFDFIRVDLYSVNGNVRFGELTLAPESGWGRFTPQEVDFELGKLWSLKA